MEWESNHGTFESSGYSEGHLLGALAQGMLGEPGEIKIGHQVVFGWKKVTWR